MTVSAAPPEVRSHGLLRATVSRFIKYIVGILLCLTPMTALVVLGWLTRKTAADIETRRAGNKPRSWPNFLLAEEPSDKRWFVRWTSGLAANLKAGTKAWIGVLAITLPFSLVWLSAWFAGWENSFSKGYELAGIWPVASLLAVFASLPVLVLLPMAIAHQAATGTITSIFEFRKITTLARAAGWRYLGLTLLVGIGFIGVFGVRALPVFAENFSVRVASGSPEAIAEYAGQFKLGMTILLFTGLLVIRYVTARVYAAASNNHENGKAAGKIKTTIVFLLTATTWLGAVFLIHVSQFLNYSWWSWLNQPVTMLPWLGILR